MRNRTLYIILEAQTDAAQSALRDPAVWMRPQIVTSNFNVKGVTVRVAQPAKPKAAKAKAVRSRPKAVKPKASRKRQKRRTARR